MTATRSDLVPLLELQRVDEAIMRISAQLAALPEDAALQAAIAERDEITPIHDERAEELARLGREQARLEDEISTLRTKLARDEGRLASGSITSPREIVNMQAELDGLTRRIGKLEDDELEIMELSEAVTATLEALRAQLDAANVRLAQASEARDAAAASLIEERTRLEAQRGELAPTIDPAVVARYEQLRKQLGGIVVAAFSKGTCGGCGLPLSPLAREEYKSSGEVWFPCENCRRVLVEV